MNKETVVCVVDGLLSGVSVKDIAEELGVKEEIVQEIEEKLDFYKKLCYNRIKEV